MNSFAMIMNSYELMESPMPFSLYLYIYSDSNLNIIYLIKF